jgi:acyl transferase domain-containing protein
VAIAAINGPQSIVLSGNSQRIKGLGEVLADGGIRFQSLAVSHAFHSPMMDPILDEFERRARLMKYSEPGIQFISNVTGGAIQSAETIDAGYWRKHVRGTVRFAEGLAAVLALKPTALIEVGPHPVLLGMAKTGDRELGIPALPTLRKGRDEWRCVFEALRQMYLLGARVDWNAVYSDRSTKADSA